MYIGVIEIWLFMGAEEVAIKGDVFTSTRIYFREFENKIYDCAWLKMKFANNPQTIYIGSFYIPSGLPRSIYTDIYDSISNTPDLVRNEIVILGDFNIPGYDEHVPSSNGKIDHLLHFLRACQLQQVNRVPNFQGRLLDLVIKNLPTLQVQRGDSPLQKEDASPSLIIYINTVY